ncbi:MAG: YitT family protein [Candidatus Izemoplasma sp.]
MSKELKKEIKKTVFITLGSLIGSIGVLWFLNPIGLYSGGLTGIAQLVINVLNHFFDISTNLGLLVFVLNIPIMIFGYMKMTRKFIYYSIFSIIIQSLFLGLIPVEIVIENDFITNAIIGGILLGIGAGLTLRVGGSMGGTDIIFQYIALNTNLTVGNLGLLLNGVIVSLSGFLFNWPIAIYTIIRVMMTNLVIDKVHTSYNYIKLEVITEHGKDVSEILVRKTRHGITVSSGKGAYSNNDKAILHTIISSYELNRIVSLIRHIDPNAFISVSTVKKVVGNFTKIIID